MVPWVVSAVKLGAVSLIRKDTVYLLLWLYLIPEYCFGFARRRRVGRKPLLALTADRRPSTTTGTRRAEPMHTGARIRRGADQRQTEGLGVGGCRWRAKPDGPAGLTGSERPGPTSAPPSGLG